MFSPEHRRSRASPASPITRRPVSPSGARSRRCAKYRQVRGCRFPFTREEQIGAGLGSTVVSPSCARSRSASTLPVLIWARDPAGERQRRRRWGDGGSLLPSGGQTPRWSALIGHRRLFASPPNGRPTEAFGACAPYCKTHSGFPDVRVDGGAITAVLHEISTARARDPRRDGAPRSAGWHGERAGGVVR